MFILKTVRMASSRKFFGESARFVSVGWSVPLKYLQSDSQRGLSCGADRARPEKIRQAVRELPRGHSDKVAVFVDVFGKNSLDALLGRAGCPREVDLVSIDIDGSDYHVFKSLPDFRPKIVCIEYNGSIPNEVDFVQPLDFDLKWGASASAICRIAEDKGYLPVAVATTNLILVRDDLVDIVVSRECASLTVLRDDTDTRNFIFSGYDGTVLTKDPLRLPGISSRRPCNLFKSCHVG
jgi:hypothetical protein